MLESPNMRLFRVPLDGAPEKEVPVDAAKSPSYVNLSAGSWNADGRLLIELRESWFPTPAVLDTQTGHLQPLPSDQRTDYVSMAWLPDGRFVALRVGEHSTLWRFSPEPDRR
jgi:hypothetical protein